MVTQVVNPVSTSTLLSISPISSISGQSVTFIASVTPNTATGTVTFKDGTRSLGTGTISGGSVSFSTNSLAVGSHSITAIYGGDNNDNGSTSSSITETVVAKPVNYDHIVTEWYIQEIPLTVRPYRSPVDWHPLRGR